jgi:hypothetical protein
MGSIREQEYDMVVDGDYCIFRSQMQGVVIGYLRGGYGPVKQVEQARQLHGWDTNRLTLFDLAVMGPVGADCRLSMVNPKGIEMYECCGAIAVAEEHIQAFLEHAADAVNK